MDFLGLPRDEKVGEELGVEAPARTLGEASSSLVGDPPNNLTMFFLAVFHSFRKEKPSLSLLLSPLSIALMADESLARRVKRRDPGGSEARV